MSRGRQPPEGLAHNIPNLVVIKLGYHAWNHLGVDHLVVFISHHHGAGKQAFQDGIAHSHAELLTKVRAKCGGSDDIIDAVSCAKALEGKGQIERNGKKLSVI